MILKMDGPKTKQEFAEMIKQNKYRFGAEIGVRAGEMAELILQSQAVSAYYLVDPWCHQPENQYHAEVNYSQEGHDQNYEWTLEKIKPFEGRAIIMRMYSHEAAQKIPDKSLDWVYIDANHCYKNMTQDLQLWTPKVKSGFMIAGHDFLDLNFPDRFGVKTAVAEFFTEDQIIHTSNTEWPIWWTIKS